MHNAGSSKVDNQKVKNPIQIEPGEGIVGRVFQFGIPRIVGDTSLDGNYIIDDRFRLSEISIPVFKNDQIIGVIDSEHPSENYYVNTDQKILTAIGELMVIHSVWSEIDEFSQMNRFWRIVLFFFFRRCLSIRRQEKSKTRPKRIYFDFDVFPTRHYIWLKLHQPVD